MLENPPALSEPASDESPLLSQLIARAGMTQPLDNNPVAQPQQGLGMPAPHSNASHSAKWPMLAALGGGIMDVGSTQHNLAKGGVEQNPLIPKGRAANGLALGGSYLANMLLSKYLNNHGHDKMAKAVGYGAGLDGALMGVHNLGGFKWPGEK